MQRLLRSPLWSRVYVVVFLIVWTGGLIRAALVGPPSTIPVVIAMVACGALLGWRLFRLGIDADRDSLVVRNRFRTTAIARADIEGFRKGIPPNMPFAAACIFAATSDEITTLDVTTRMTVLPASRRRVEHDLTVLRAWLHTGAVPTTARR